MDTGYSSASSQDGNGETISVQDRSEIDIATDSNDNTAPSLATNRSITQALLKKWENPESPNMLLCNLCINLLLNFTTVLGMHSSLLRVTYRV